MHNFFYPGAFMNPGDFGSFGPMLGLGAVIFGALLLIATAWSLVWKGIALWYAARGGEKIWFIALLLVNTLGILEILYIFVFRKEKWAVFSKRVPNLTKKSESAEEKLPVAESSPAE